MFVSTVDGSWLLELCDNGLILQYDPKFLCHHEEGIRNYSPHNRITFKEPLKKKLLKTLWEMEKILLASIFSLSHNVFYPI